MASLEFGAFGEFPIMKNILTNDLNDLCFLSGKYKLSQYQED